MADARNDCDAAVLVSGGVDSAILSVDLLSRFRRVFPIYVRFGLRWEATELQCLRRFLLESEQSHRDLMPLTILDEPIEQVYADHWSNAGRPGVPGAETDDTAVYLPGRNVLLAGKAAVWCRLREIETLAIGILEANPFPDSSSEFFEAYEAVLNRAMNGRLRIIRPYAGIAKPVVVRRGVKLRLPLDLTFSCLNPVGGRHCGACNKCAERRKAFREVEWSDRTEYASSASEE